MSVTGIDFGNSSCVIAVAQKGGIDVIQNEVSSRQTATMAAFSDKERYLGEAAATQYLRNIKNTINGVKLLMGRKFNEPEVQQELKSLPFKAVELGNHDIGIEVMYAGEKKIFTPVAIAGMIIQKLRDITEKATGKPAADVVISVPGWWTDKQRHSMLDAAKIGGVHCLRVFNETTAAALSYGIYKSNQFDEKEPTRVMFFDMGETTTSVSIAEFFKGKLKILATAYDRKLGGRNVDDVLCEHFLAEFKTKYKIDIKSNQKAYMRLQIACEKMKKMLNSIPEAPINVDSIMNDIDVKGTMKRTEFETMIKPLLDRITVPVKQVLEASGITADKLSAVEIIGGATRLTAVQAKLGEILNKEVSKTLNFEEAVAKGCALQCAMLSPVFKVREFSVTDVSLYPIKLSWKNVDAMTVDGTKDTAELFPKNTSVPTVKMISLFRNQPVELLAEYADPTSIPEGSETFIGKFIVDVPSVSGEPPKLRIKVKLDINGMVAMDGAEMVETMEEAPGSEEKPAEPATPPQPEPMQDATPTTPQPPESPSASDDKKAEDSKKKNKVKKTTLTVQEKHTGLSSKDLQHLVEEEGKMLAADRLAIETAEKKNAVESYVYDMRNKLSDSYSEFATSAEKDALSARFTETEDWLYGEGADATKSVYMKKLDELKSLGDPISKRFNEHENRYEALGAIKSAIENFRMLATSADPKYDHITKEDRDKVTQECSNAEKWVTENMMKQEKTAKNANPVVLVADINKKNQELSKACNTIMNKPKPAPPKEEKKPEPEKKPEEAKPTTEEPKPAETKTESKKEESKQTETNKSDMDLD